MDVMSKHLAELRADLSSLQNILRTLEEDMVSLQGEAHDAIKRLESQKSIIKSVKSRMCNVEDEILKLS